MAGLLLLLTFHLGDVPPQPPHKLMRRTHAESDKSQLRYETPEAAPIPVIPDLFPDPRKRGSK